MMYTYMQGNGRISNGPPQKSLSLSLPPSLPPFPPSKQPEGQAPILGHTFDGSHTFLYPHLHFAIGYNRDQIVSVNVTTLYQRKIDILSPEVKEVEFSYSVDWIEEPESAWADRMLRYADSRFIPNTFEVRVICCGDEMEKGRKRGEGKGARCSHCWCDSGPFFFFLSLSWWTGRTEGGWRSCTAYPSVCS